MKHLRILFASCSLLLLSVLTGCLGGKEEPVTLDGSGDPANPEQVASSTKSGKSRDKSKGGVISSVTDSETYEDLVAGIRARDSDVIIPGFALQNYDDRVLFTHVETAKSYSMKLQPVGLSSETKEVTTGSVEFDQEEGLSIVSASGLDEILKPTPAAPLAPGVHELNIVWLATERVKALLPVGEELEKAMAYRQKWQDIADMEMAKLRILEEKSIKAWEEAMKKAIEAKKPNYSNPAFSPQTRVYEVNPLTHLGLNDLSTYQKHLSKDDQEAVKTSIRAVSEAKAYLNGAMEKLDPDDGFNLSIQKTKVKVEVSDEGEISFADPQQLSAVTSDSAILISQGKVCQGLLKLNGETPEIITRKDIDKRITSEFEDLRLWLTSDFKREFEQRAVHLKADAVFFKGALLNTVRFRVCRESSGELLTLEDGSKELVSSDWTFETSLSPANDGGRAQMISRYTDLDILGQQGRFRFMGQVTLEHRNGTETCLPPFTFTVGNYKEEISLEVDPGGGALMAQDPRSNDSVPNRTKLEVAGKALAITKAHRGRYLCIQTDAPALQVYDLAEKQWTANSTLKINPDGTAEGGASGLYVYYPSAGILERWDAATGERQAAKLVTLPPGKFLGMAAPDWNPKGLVFLASELGVLWVDPLTLEEVPIQIDVKKRSDAKESATDLKIAERVANSLRPPLVEASGDGGAYLISTEPNTNNRVTVDPHIRFVLSLSAKRAEVDATSDDYILAFARNNGYGKQGANLIDSRYRIGRFKASSPVFADSCMQGFIGRVETADEITYPPRPAQMTLNLVPVISATSSTPRDMGVLEVAELSGTGVKPEWERGLFCAQYDAMAFLPDDGSYVALYELGLEARMKRLGTEWISPGPALIEKGEQVEHPVVAAGPVTELRLLEGPEGAYLTEDRTLVWDSSQADQSTPAKFTIEAIASNGESSLSEVETQFVNTGGMLVKLDSDYRSPGIPIAARSMPMSGWPHRVLLAGSGKYLIVSYFDKQLIDVFDLESESIYLSLEHSAVEPQLAADAKGLFLYDSMTKILERIDLSDPELRARTSIPYELLGLGAAPYGVDKPLVVLQKLPQQTIAQETIDTGFGRTMTISRTTGGGSFVDLLEPNGLTPLLKEFSPEWTQSIQEASSNQERHFGLPASPSGEFVFLGKGLISFEKPGSLSITPYSNVGDQRSALMDDGKHFVDTYRIGELGPNDTQFTRFGATGYGELAVTMPGSEFFLIGDVEHSQSKVWLGKLGTTEPLFYMTGLDELKEPSHQDGDIKESQRLFMVPSLKKMITVGIDRQIYIRDVDLDTLLTKLNVSVN